MIDNIKKATCDKQFQHLGMSKKHTEHSGNANNTDGSANVVRRWIMIVFLKMG